MSPDPKPAAKRERDIRLDFFRGVAMIVILIAHITDNPWNLFMPGRFGFSDATEVFVFCSGMASALAFGAIFARAGWLLGTARILHRIWQVYWVHIGVFFVALFLMLMANYSDIFARDEVGALNLYPFLRNTPQNFVGLVTLTYVPNFFDVLPMYIVLLALVPGMVLIARVDPMLALLTSVTLWAFATTGGLQIPAEWWFPNGSTRSWFFNPFAWQLVFFTGYGLIAGWIPVPPVRRELVILALAIVLISLPFAWYKTIGASDFLKEWRRDWWPLYDKTRLGALRYVHFLALAYLGWAAAGVRGARLKALAAEWPRLIGAVVDIGKQSLAVFAVSMVLARVLGAFLKLYAFSGVATLTINLIGLVLIWLTARLAGWFKSQPWQKPARPAAALPAQSEHTGRTASEARPRTQEVKA